MKKGELLDRFASLLFPQGCVLCGETVEYDSLWCGKCPLCAVTEVACNRCGHTAGGCVCGRVDWAFRRNVSALHYTLGAREAVLLFKKKPDRRACLFFANMMAQAAAREYKEVAFDCITEVPMAPEQLIKRGHNQAELLGAELGAMLGLPHERRVLARQNASGPQHALDAAARFQNAARAYTIARPGAVRGKTVLLVDDVMTTGATLQACAEALRGAGARAVYALTATITPRGK